MCQPAGEARRIGKSRRCGRWSRRGRHIGFFFATLTFFLATLKNVAMTAIFATKMLQKNVARNFKSRVFVAMSMLQGFCKMTKMLQRQNS